MRLTQSRDDDDAVGEIRVRHVRLGAWSYTMRRRDGQLELKCRGRHCCRKPAWPLSQATRAASTAAEYRPSRHHSESECESWQAQAQTAPSLPGWGVTQAGRDRRRHDDEPEPPVCSEPPRRHWQGARQGWQATLEAPEVIQVNLKGSEKIKAFL